MTVMRLKYILGISLAVVAFTFTACGGGEETVKDYSKEVDAGKITGQTYTCEELGWTMNYPETWTITKKSSLEAADKLSKANYDSDSVNTSGIKRLFAFQKDFDNHFQSTMEPLGDKEYAKVISGLKDQLFANYFDQHINADTSTSKLTIDGVTFDCIQIRLFDRNGKQYAKQQLFTRVIEGNYFNAIVTSTNDKDHERILGEFKKSKFTKKD
jgi:hypothetical protein